MLLLILLLGYRTYAGFQVSCEFCKALLQEPKPTEAIYGLIENLDNGGLRYPRMEILVLCKLTCNFVSSFVKSHEVRRTNRVCNLLLSALLPHFTQCPDLICEKHDSEHTEELCNVLLSKLLWVGSINSTIERFVQLAHKPLSPKNCALVKSFFMLYDLGLKSRAPDCSSVLFSQ